MNDTSTTPLLLNTLMRRYKQTESENAKKYYGRFLSTRPCATCGGRRLKPEVLAVKIGEASELGSLPMLVISIGAVLEGSIFGDHCSPISDTTIASALNVAVNLYGDRILLAMVGDPEASGP